VGRLLIIAYHFPPCAGSSGLLRSEKFARYLPEFGWETSVLTVHPRAYESVDSRYKEMAQAPVVHAFALDTKKHLSYRGAYLDWMALPDRWLTWVFGAIPSGLRMIRKRKVEVIFSTFPIATAILIGLILHRLTGKPWVVDLRDSMTEDDYPKDPRTRKVRRWIERQAIHRASRVIFTSESTLKMYLERYPDLLRGNCLLIPNGYDEDDFASLAIPEARAASPGRRLKLLHTGLIYPEERDPVPFFRALSRLKSEKSINSADLSIVFRASGSEELFQKIINELNIADLIQLRPHIPYKQSLQECADADGLLLFQAGNCDHQTPAKTYEYLRLQKPILAVTTHTGDTAALLNQVGGATIVKLADQDDIYSRLPAFLAALRTNSHPLPRLNDLQRFARKSQAEELARCLSGLGAETSSPEAKQEESFAR
jgi:glycosyltransferase involved in cell wall biosynthesis